MGVIMTEQYDQQLLLLRRSHRWKLAFFGLVILIAGVVIGTGLTLITVRQRQRHFLVGLEAVNEQMIRGLQHTLELTPSQQTKIEAIITNHIEALRKIREQARPQIAKEMNQLYEEVRNILDERQQIIWDQQILQLQNRLWQPRGPGAGQGPGRGQGAGRGQGPRGPGPLHRPFRFWEEQSTIPRQPLGPLPPSQSPPQDKEIQHQP